LAGFALEAPFALADGVDERELFLVGSFLTFSELLLAN
jgi:hypothetical protein